MLFEEYYQYLSGGKEHVEIVYESQLALMPFPELLKEALEKDKVLKYSTAGIHNQRAVPAVTSELKPKNWKKTGFIVVPVMTWHWGVPGKVASYRQANSWVSKVCSDQPRS